MRSHHVSDVCDAAVGLNIHINQTCALLQGSEQTGLPVST